MAMTYYWIGKIVFWLSVSIGTTIMLGWSINTTFNFLGMKYRSIWIIAEYAAHRQKFRKWLKTEDEKHYV